MCVGVYHTPVLYRNGCTDRADFAYRFPLAYATLYFSEIRNTIKLHYINYIWSYSTILVRIKYFEIPQNSDEGHFDLTGTKACNRVLMV